MQHNYLSYMFTQRWKQASINIITNLALTRINQSEWKNHAGIKLTKTIFLHMCAAISAWAQNVNYTMPRTEFNFLVYSCSGGSSLVRCGTAKTARNIVRIILRYGGRERERRIKGENKPVS